MSTATQSLLTVDVETLHEGLAQVMPGALVMAADEAAERVEELSGPTPAGVKITAGPRARQVEVLAASLGAIAPSFTANALNNWLAKHGHARPAFLPAWLRPAIDPGRTPKLTTMTSFANDRSRVIREAVDESRPVLISRHGRIVAAIVPLEPGAYETEVYRTAGRARMVSTDQQPPLLLSEDDAEAIRTADDPLAKAAELGVDLSAVDTSDWSRPESSD